MTRPALALAVVISLSVCHSVSGQTWSIDVVGSGVLLNADAYADDFTAPGFDDDVQTDGTFQAPFVDLIGDNYTIGENVAAQAINGRVTADGASVVKANDGAALNIQWRAATDLEMRGDLIGYYADAHADLTSTLSVQLSGLIPGKFYEISYDYRVEAIAIEDHEGPLEDPEDAASALTFTFGTAPAESFLAMAGPSNGFPATESFSGSGSYVLLAGAAPLSLDVAMSANANAILNPPPINGSPPEDGAGSEGFGHLNFSATLIPEPSGLALLSVASTLLCLRRRRRS